MNLTFIRFIGNRDFNLCLGHKFSGALRMGDFHGNIGKGLERVWAFAG